MSSNSSGRSAINTNLSEVGLAKIDNKIQPSMKTSGRGNEKTWTLKGNNLIGEYNKPVRGNSKTELSYSHTNEMSERRPPSKRLTSLGRPESSNRSSQNKLPSGGLGEGFPTGTDFTVIHVIDENNKKQKDFRCSLPLLLKHMKYFEKHLKASESTDDIDISVHWDVHIFEWLMNYIETDEKIAQSNDNIKFYDVVTKDGDAYKVAPIAKRRKPNFEIRNAISILISSDYLRMNSLVDECLDYFISNINDILKLAIDMSCIVGPLQRKIAVKMTDEDLDKIKDKKDKLCGKLYMNKLHILLEDDTKTLYKCSYCNKLFTQNQQEKFACPKAKIFIDFHGKVIANHMFDRTFEIKKFINYLRNTMKYSWKQVYWKIYAHTLDFDCKTWGKKFNGPYAKHWYYHPGKAIFSFGSNKGTYTCWKQETLRFDTSIRNEGCMTQDHEPNDKENLFEKILDPCRVYSTQDPFPKTVEQEPEDEENKEKDESESYYWIAEAVKRYIKEVDNTWMLEEEDEDRVEFDLPRTNSLSPGRKRTGSLMKRGSNSPIRMKSNIKNENNKTVNTCVTNDKDLPAFNGKSIFEKELREKEETKEYPNETAMNENHNTSTQNLTTDKTTNNTSCEYLGESAPKPPKSPSKKKRKKPKSISWAPSFLQTSTRAMRDYIRDTRRDEDRDNMNMLIYELKQARRDENSKKGGVRFNGKNTRIIRKKDIRIHNRRGIGTNITQSKRKIIGSQGVITKGH